MTRFDTGKLLLTGGVSSLDGAAGGGLTPWAVIGSNATDGETGVTANATRIGTRDCGLMSRLQHVFCPLTVGNHPLGQSGQPG